MPLSSSLLSWQSNLIRQTSTSTIQFLNPRIPLWTFEATSLWLKIVMESSTTTTSTASESEDRVLSLTSSASPASSSSLSPSQESQSPVQVSQEGSSSIDKRKSMVKLDTMITHTISQPLPQPTIKKRGFDIASLVDPENSSSFRNYSFENSGQSQIYHVQQQFQTNPTTSPSKKKKTTKGNPSESKNNSSNGVKLEGLAAQLSASIQSLQSSQQQFLQQRHSSLSTQNPNRTPNRSIHTEVNNNERSETPSAFRKVDKHSNGQLHQQTVSSMMPPNSAAHSLPFSLLSSLYTMSAAGRGFFPPNPMPPPITSVSNANSLLPQTFPNSHLSSVFNALPQFPPQPSTVSQAQSSHSPHTKNSKASQETHSRSEGHLASKSGTGSSSLLPFLPPSLAALSFPQTNWCAKCNASFRMTSDLVYHMRSHHKPSSVSDPVKKKREEKLRCNICGESFRERHHLTRHMTSHQ